MYKIEKNNKEVTNTPKRSSTREDLNNIKKELENLVQKLSPLNSNLIHLKAEVINKINSGVLGVNEATKVIIDKIIKAVGSNESKIISISQVLSEIKDKKPNFSEIEEAIDSKFDYQTGLLSQIKDSIVSKNQIEEIFNKRFNTIEKKIDNLFNVFDKHNDLQHEFHNEITNTVKMLSHEISLLSEKIKTDSEVNDQLLRIESSLKDIGEFKFQFQKINEIAKTTSVLSSNTSLVENRIKNFESKINLMKDEIDKLQKELTRTIDLNIRNSQQSQQKTNSHLLNVVTGMSDTIIKAIQLVDRKGDIDIINNQLRQLSSSIGGHWNKKIQEIKSISKVSEEKIEKTINNLFLQLRSIQVELESMNPGNTEKAKLELGNRISAMLNEFYKKLDQNFNSHLLVLEKKIEK